MRKRKTESDPCHAIELAEGSQYYQRVTPCDICKTFRMSCLDKGLVNDEQAAFAAHRLGQRQQSFSIRDATIGVVGIDHHRIVVR
ncbi:hypothetical protein D3C77_649570 [compost metagenome]